MAIQRFGFLVLCLCWGAASAAEVDRESFSYRAIYQGLLSVMAPVSIADIRLDVQRVGNDPLHVMTLSLTSEAHPLMDAFYPIRYRLRSVYDTQTHGLWAYERYKRTAEIKHDMVVVHPHLGTLELRKSDKAGMAELPELLRPWFSEIPFSAEQGKVLQVPDAVLDRLSLLQHLRLAMPTAGQTLSLSVTNGSKLFDYRVVNEGRDVLEIAGKSRDCWRVRIEGFVHRERGEPKSEHEPVHVWLSDDAARIPLRFHSNVALGSFTVEWQEQPADFAIEISDQPLQVAPAEAFSEG